MSPFHRGCNGLILRTAILRNAFFMAAAAPLLAGYASNPTFNEYYPPVTDAERSVGHGVAKVMDYRKPTGVGTIFGFSLF